MLDRTPPWGKHIAELSICIPTRDRPEMVQRAVMSVTQGIGEIDPTSVEVIVTDNSEGLETGQLVRPMLDRWPGPSRYVHNVPGVGMVGNFNRCIELATSEWILILHDDDYLLPGGVSQILAGVRGSEPTDRAVLFGVRVVDGKGRLLRLQVSPRRARLEAKEALQRHLTRSSFVRFPAIVVHRDAYLTVGPFDDSVRAATDLEMWGRIFSSYGVRLEPRTVVAYVVHAEAATEQMFTGDYVATILEIFERAAAFGLLSESELQRARSHWFNQFVLAGTWRRLRVRDREGARAVLGLFRNEGLRDLKPSMRWLPVRLGFSALAGMGAAEGDARRRAPN